MIKEKAKEIVDNMSDAEAVRFLKHFGESLFRETPRQSILEGIAEENAKLTEMQDLMALDVNTRKTALNIKDSGYLARSVLEGMVQDEALASAIVSTWKGYKSDELFVGTILTAGFVAGMLLVVATTEIEFQVKGVKFKKHPATSEQIKAVTEPFFGVLRKIF